mmetsp:Transcript_28893/g.77833  ORF Transcript_28893/g.77833 Transcript_28893/m.77833 type:complete len:381 (+) Transcript_28893:945-2087(+)
MMEEKSSQIASITPFSPSWMWMWPSFSAATWYISCPQPTSCSPGVVFCRAHHAHAASTATKPTLAAIAICSPRFLAAAASASALLFMGSASFVALASLVPLLSLDDMARASWSACWGVMPSFMAATACAFCSAEDSVDNWLRAFSRAWCVSLTTAAACISSMTAVSAAFMAAAAILSALIVDVSATTALAYSSSSCNRTVVTCSLISSISSSFLFISSCSCAWSPGSSASSSRSCSLATVSACCCCSRVDSSMICTSSITCSCVFSFFSPASTASCATSCASASRASLSWAFSWNLAWASMSASFNGLALESCSSSMGPRAIAAALASSMEDRGVMLLRLVLLLLPPPACGGAVPWPWLSAGPAFPEDASCLDTSSLCLR